ncbi:MAG: rhamnulokinase family protein [Synoicihabitans sp.]
MSKKNIHLAIDLGAGSGRVLAGEWHQGRIDLHEVHRFVHQPLTIDSAHHWDADTLRQDILDGLKLAVEKFGNRIASMGVDTWGVDYGLVDEQGKLLCPPYQYRDNRTDGMMERAAKLMPENEIYARTGIQFMFINTLYQLLSEKEAGSNLDDAADLLFMPDLVAFWLTGKRVQERTIASTSQIYNPTTRAWDAGLIEAMELPARLFKPLTDPGTVLGPITSEIAEATGLEDVHVVTVGGHDTASAVAAVPATGGIVAYLSSGTWSLMGVERPEPMISLDSFADGFTNEIGFGDTVRFLKNICGLWLIQESRRTWQEQGKEISFAEMSAQARAAEPFRSLINPDDPGFAKPGDMPERIREQCRASGQPVPESVGQLVRCIYESLALRYRQVWGRLISYLPDTPECIHIVGGGCQDRLLNQMAANAIGIPVKAGPVEATGLGNIMAQLVALGEIPDLARGREVVGASESSESFLPQDAEVWDAAAKKLEQLSLSRDSD